MGLQLLLRQPRPLLRQQLQPPPPPRLLQLLPQPPPPPPPPARAAVPHQSCNVLSQRNSTPSVVTLPPTWLTAPGISPGAPGVLPAARRGGRDAAVRSSDIKLSHSPTPSQASISFKIQTKCSST